MYRAIMSVRGIGGMGGTGGMVGTPRAITDQHAGVATPYTEVCQKLDQGVHILGQDQVAIYPSVRRLAQKMERFARQVVLTDVDV